MSKKYFINVVGGTGLNFALASFITAVKEKYPDMYSFYVCSPYFDIFQCCEAVDGVYKPNEIRDFIFDAKAMDAEIVNHRLYDMDGFIKKQMTYPMAWAKLCGIEWPEEKAADTLSKLNPNSHFPHCQTLADDILKDIKSKGFDDFIIVNFEGGVSPLTQVPMKTVKNDKGQDVQVADWSSVPDNYENEPLRRHYSRELAQEFCDLYRKAHPKTAILNFSLPNQGNYNGTFKYTVPYLVYYILSQKPECKRVVAIDSCLQHMIAGINKTVVIWGHSAANEEMLPFGYKFNTNIIQPCRRDDILFFSALGASAAKIDYIKPEELLDIVDNAEYGHTYCKIDGEYVAND